LIFTHTMRTAICTISTQSHLSKSLTLFDSIKQYSDTNCCCLVSDMVIIEKINGIQFHILDTLNDDKAQKIKRKYKGDKLRWALKSIYVKYLLENGFDQVIYVDNDIYFFNSPQFLFDKLNSSNFILTPHFYPSNPMQSQNWLEANFRVGLFNAGFFGANQNAKPILEWWANCCL